MILGMTPSAWALIAVAVYALCYLVSRVSYHEGFKAGGMLQTEAMARRRSR